ncbi:GTPase [Phycicoccus endophyticus]|uniref:GTPase n=1 Tax=Phycicoccus endophyticus TaxID=1690220 RepID=UPI0021CEF5FC|nr:GTPase [Phycicoccus endophyticus]
MSPLVMGSATGPGVSPERLSAAADALSAAVDAGAGELPAEESARAGQVVAKVAQRTALVGGHTVVALAGATGSGKSSLFNVLVGEEVARVGVRRPTTATPTAGVWGAEPAGDLLDWLGVGARHHVGEAGGGPRWAVSTAWSCSTCPTSTRARPPTGSRPSGSSSWSTCSSG